jgi:uncharacterized protein (TIGR02646 family)
VIRVAPQPEPPDFDERVRKPGEKALTSRGRKLPPLWRECLTDLHRAYSGICAYAAIYIDVTGSPGVDHYVAKSSDRRLAYEWSNYRLACGLMNARKGAFDEVLDPFEIEDGWFLLNEIDGGVRPNPDLEPPVRKRVQDTIDRLGLDGSEFRQHRLAYIDGFEAGRMDFDWLRNQSPFVARELVRIGAVPRGDGLPRWPG